MIVRLSHPIAFNGGTIDHVTVRVPPETGWDANPPDGPQGLWNLINAVGLPHDVVMMFTEFDLDAILEACLEVGSQWNAIAAGEFTTSRAFRRRSNRR